MSESDRPEPPEPQDTTKKSRVLHTRVPAVLEQELKQLAQNLKVPVSNVVRAILEDAIETMDVATTAAQDELRSVAARLRGPGRPPKAPAPAGPPLAGAIGVAHITLMQDARCGLTGRALAKGQPALLVHFQDGRPPLVVAEDALPAPVASAPGEEEER